VDLDVAGLHVLGLREFDGKHAVTVSRLDLVGLDRNGQRQGPLEFPEPALSAIVVLLLRLLLPRSLPSESQHVSCDREVDVLLGEPWKLGRDHEFILGLVHVDGGSPEPLHGAALALSAKESIEQAVDLGLDIGNIAERVDSGSKRTESNE